MVLPYTEPGVAQPGEEVGGVGGAGGGLADGALEALPGCFREAAAGGLLSLSLSPVTGARRAVRSSRDIG
ncbi:hypothetical protein [Streptomyces sp. t99]|uniref:hypothetical protein n=1 Tax=Streptomyces sp. t99 TaxID=1828172 RepID=UPI000BFDC4C6|nr:hypothetical protein [Streptomyces sp. t99]